MRRLLTMLAAALAVSCTGPSGKTEPAAKPERRLAGSWNRVHYIMAYDAEGVTGPMADVAAAGQAMIGKKDFGGPACLDASQVAADDLTIRLREAISFGPEWTVRRSAVKQGTVDFEATMDDPQAGKGTLTITGTISATTTDLVVTSDAHQPAPGKGHIRTVMKQENTRMGDCTPGETGWN